MDDKHYDEVSRLELAGRNLEERGLSANVLCARCTRSHLFRRRGQLQVNVYCHSLERLVPADIEECSAFTEQNRMDLDDMNKLALKIDPRPGVSDGSYL